ncbi:MAG TPA: CPBP family intramembrane glutamic endopeptidase [Pyrinomonadaceae bacterium]|nr:CPBP family intramembrane glutamic endopeptidase [Pyrinomonadaceae bacterium]
MEARNFFLNDGGRLRSGWRLAVFAIAFLIFAKIGFAFKQAAPETLNGTWGFVIGAGILFASATLVGWGCGAVFEELPFRAIGWSFHRGWFRNVAIGSALGALSLLLAAACAIATRGLSFSRDSLEAASIEKTLLVSAIIFVFAASAEEVLFRGYPLQTLTRANLAWLGVLLTSVPFAVVHLNNPNVSRGFTFVNTALAGVWLAIAYLRTRSLWFPLGLHWSWNWAQASLLGLPVSGIDRLAPAPLLHAMNAGPDWLTGGAYGIEGGAACTIALLISTLVVWRTKLIVRAVL